MQRYPQSEPYEREPLDPSYDNYDSPSRRRMPPSQGYSPAETPYYDASPRVHHGGQPDYGQTESSYGAGSYDSPQHYAAAPVPPGHHYNTHGESSHNMNEYVPDDGRLPPPPSRSEYPHMPPQAYAPNSPGHGYGGDSHSSLAGLGASAMPPGGITPPGGRGSDHHGDRYQGFSSRSNGDHLGVVNPNEIADDGDDGLNYHKHSQRNSMLSLPQSDRSPNGKQAVGTAAAVGATGGILGRGGEDGSFEKSGDWAQKQKRNKCWKWLVIILVFLIIVGAIIGGVVGGVFRGGGSGSKNDKGESAKDDQAKNGDLNINSDEIKKLMNNPNLHKVFPGMDYTPLNTQYPHCMHDPPSQNNITRDVAVLSQLTNKIRLYGTDCNQTQMLIHAIDRLDMKDDVKIWLGVWQDDNSTTNARQLEQMWTILDDYGKKPFEGIIVANEILFRKQMKETDLAKIMSDVRKNLTDKGINLPVATSDLGDDWTADLAKDSDYIMANIHPFFAGVDAKNAASWTYSFWENQNSQFFKSNKQRNIISETGWPTAGGKNCGGSSTCTDGSVAGITELNQFMEDWVCAALRNGTEYFWFEAFDEPWKIQFNEKGKNWEDKWGLMDVNRNLKDGVKIPDCGGKTVS